MIEDPQVERRSGPRSLAGWAVFIFIGLSASVIAFVRYMRDGAVCTFDGWLPAEDHPIALVVNIALNLLALFGLAIVVWEALRQRAKSQRSPV